MDQIALAVGVASITLVGSLIGSLIGNVIAPSIEDTRVRQGIDRRRKINAIDSIYLWVSEHLTAATLVFFAASERSEDWRSAVLRYEESDAAYTHTLALVKRLKSSKEVESQLSLLVKETENMLKEYAWKKLHLQTTEKDDLNLRQQFEKAKVKAIEHASEVYLLLDKEAAELLRLRKISIL